jgi:hypothetical protein
VLGACGASGDTADNDEAALLLPLSQPGLSRTEGIAVNWKAIAFLDDKNCLTLARARAIAAMLGKH